MLINLMLPDGFWGRSVTMADLETAVSLFNLCSIDEIGVPDETPDSVRRFWQTPRFDLATSTLALFTPGGQMIGYANVSDTADVPVQPRIWLRVHPAYQDSWVGQTLYNWAEARVCQAVARVPDGIRVAMVMGVLSTAESQKRLLEQNGMTLARTFWRMVTDINTPPPAPQWPEGITLRTYQDYPDLRAIFAALDEGFQDHWGFVEEPIDQVFPQFAHHLENNPDFDPSLCLVAMDGEQIAGVSINLLRVEDDPDMGWVDDLSIRRPWRRRGLALALLHHAFGEFYRRGKKRAGLGVDASSLTGATRLYEKAGMHPTWIWLSYEKELRPGKDISKQTLE